MGDDLKQLEKYWDSEISIHVPRMGDDKPIGDAEAKITIPIHVPRMGDDFSFCP